MKSSSVLPLFNSLVSQRGFIPRPVHVLPSGPRYFGTIVLRRALDPFTAPLFSPP